AIVSLLTNVPVRKDVAMTGEITLRGKVLPIGGLKEKLLAAHRAGIKVVVLPKENEKDLTEVPQEVMQTFDVNLVDMLDEVLQVALDDTAVRETAPEGMVPLWGRRPAADAPASNSTVD